MSTYIEKEFARLGKGAKNQQELDAAYAKALAAFKGTQKPKRKRGPGRTWKQIGGDVNPKDHGAVLAKVQGDSVEVVRIDVNDEGPGWYVTTATFDKDDLGWNGQADGKTLAKFIGVDERDWNRMSIEEQGEVAIQYHGSGWGGNDKHVTKWSEALPAKSNQIKWWR